ncbi:MAG: glycosyltransferase family 4 protein [Deltaproteobacteria bacterium]|nr:glycosyltransferase family 4 protein [Deltaproteobacteria bacterium]
MAEKPKKILYVQYTNPAAFPPLENSAWILANSGWKVKFLGTEALGFENISIVTHPNIESVLVPFCPAGLKQKIHYVKYLFSALREIASRDYQCVYVSDLFSSPVGWLGAKFFKIRVFYHEHDTPEVPHSTFTRLLHWTRTQLSEKAEVCVFPQEERAKKFLAQFSKAKVLTCFNMPLKSTISSIDKASTHPEFVLWYHGSLLEERFPLEVVKALKYLPSQVKLKFAGYETLSSKGFVERLLRCAKEYGVEERVEYCGVFARAELFQIAQHYHLGLVLFDRKFVQPMVGASNKPFDYLACGLPILTNDSKDWVEFFEKKGLGKSCNPESVESIAQAIRELLADTDQFCNMRKRGLEKISTEWNYEAQFAPIQKLLEN